MGDELHEVGEIPSDVCTTETMGNLPLIAERLQLVSWSRESHEDSLSSNLSSHQCSSTWAEPLVRVTCYA